MHLWTCPMWPTNVYELQMQVLGHRSKVQWWSIKRTWDQWATNERPMSGLRVPILSLSKSPFEDQQFSKRDPAIGRRSDQPWWEQRQDLPSPHPKLPVRPVRRGVKAGAVLIRLGRLRRWPQWQAVHIEMWAVHIEMHTLVVQWLMMLATEA